jgi:hypothetical protein
MISLEELFSAVENFSQEFEPCWQQQLLGSGLKLRHRLRGLSLREIITILIAFHQSCYRNFKAYYQTKVQTEWARRFPGLVSDPRLIDWVPSTLIPMWSILAIALPSIALSIFSAD